MVSNFQFQSHNPEAKKYVLDKKILLYLGFTLYILCTFSVLKIQVYLRGSFLIARSSGVVNDSPDGFPASKNKYRITHYSLLALNMIIHQADFCMSFNFFPYSFFLSEMMLILILVIEVPASKTLTDWIITITIIIKGKLCLKITNLGLF